MLYTFKMFFLLNYIEVIDLFYKESIENMFNVSIKSQVVYSFDHMWI